MSEPFNNIIDLDLSITSSKKFRIDGDDNRILELNTSDIGIITRLNDAYPKLNDLQEKATRITSGLDTVDSDGQINLEGIGIMSGRLKEVDEAMRDLVDYIFNSNVSGICVQNGSMYDPFNGSFRYEYIITLLMKQYEDNLQSEFAKMEKQMKKHTDKYIKGRK